MSKAAAQKVEPKPNADLILARTRALTAEHEPHEWWVETPLYAVSNSIKRPGYYMGCSCGWRGWIMEDPEKPVKALRSPMF